MRPGALAGALLATALAVGGAAAEPARADGLPVLGVDAGPTGVATPDGASRYVTLRAGPTTVLARVAQQGGRVEASRSLRGVFTIPAVAYDGSPDGLSADGRTLVLIAPRAGFPRARTTLVALDAARLRVRRTIALRGDFSFDALSPDGSRLFLIQYVSRTDPTRYRVRAYDLRSGRLLPKPVVDPREPDEAMHGRPLTRATSPDGRWAYTLYDAGGGTPFVHALDTAAATARCIDLDLLAGRDLAAARLDVPPAEDRIDLVVGGSPVATIDARTFVVEAPPAIGPAGAVATGVLMLAIAVGGA